MPALPTPAMSLHKRRLSADTEAQRKPLLLFDSQRCAAKAKAANTACQSVLGHFTPFRAIAIILALAVLLIFTLPPLIDNSLSPYLEVSLALTSLAQAESHCHSQPHSDVIVTLTTLPKRIEHIDRTLKTVLLGTVCPSKILVWMPTFNRRLNQRYTLPQWLVDYNATSTLVKIYGIDRDYGPGTKLIAPLVHRQWLNVSDTQRIVVIDDDVLYSTKLIQTHHCYSQALPAVATGIVGCNLESSVSDGDSEHYDPYCYRGEKQPSPVLVSVLFGTASFLVRPQYVNLTFIDEFDSVAPYDAHYEDDWFFASLLALSRVPRMVLPLDRRQLVQMDTLWTKRGALIDTDNSGNGHWRAMIDYYRESGAEANDAELFARFDNAEHQRALASPTLAACLAQR